MASSIGLQAGNGTEEGEVVITERLVDLISHAQAAEAQDRRLPQHEHVKSKGIFHVFGSIAIGAEGLSEKVGNLALRVENCLAPHFGGVSGEHGTDPKPPQHATDFRGVRPGGLNVIERRRQTSNLGR